MTRARYKKYQKYRKTRLFAFIRERSTNTFAPRVVNKTSRYFYNADLVPSEVNHGQSQGFKGHNKPVQGLKFRTGQVQKDSGRWIPGRNKWILYLLTNRHLVATKNRENNHRQDRVLAPLVYQHQKA